MDPAVMDFGVMLDALDACATPRSPQLADRLAKAREVLAAGRIDGARLAQAKRALFDAARGGLAANAAALVGAMIPEGRRHLAALDPEGGFAGYAVAEHGDQDAVVRFASDQIEQGRSAYWTINPVRAGWSGNKPAGGDLDATRVACLLADIDPPAAASGADPAAHWADQRAAMLALARRVAAMDRYRPGAVIVTGNGVQFVYRFRDLAAAPEAAKAAWAGVLRAIGSDAVQNPDRLARLPGVNAPNAKKRREGRDEGLAVALLIDPEALYAVADMPAIRYALRAVDGMPEARAAQGDDEPASTGDAAVSEAIAALAGVWGEVAHADAERLSDAAQALLARSPALRRRFEGDDHGLPDPSGSGFVMALASIVKKCGGTAGAFAELAFASDAAFAHLRDRDAHAQRRALARAWSRTTGREPHAFGDWEDPDAHGRATPAEGAPAQAGQDAALAKARSAQLDLIQRDAAVPAADARRLLDALLTGGIAFDRQAKSLAEGVGCGVGALRELRAKVLALLPKAPEPAAEQGMPSLVEELDPWPEPVDGEALAETIRAAFRAYVVFPTEHDADAATLWVLGTYLMDRWGLWPKLLVRSPEKRCGKTTMLEVVAAFAARALPVANISPAAIFRVIEAACPTLILDEADRFLKHNDEANGILNAGHTRTSARVVRVEKVGEELRPGCFSVWAPVVVASIGGQMDTLEDRSIRVDLRRRLPDEARQRMPFDLADRQRAARRRLLRWAADAGPSIAELTCEPPECGNDRARDNWTPLWRVAAALGGPWPGRVAAAYAFKEVGQDPGADDSMGVMALTDVMEAFEARPGEKWIGSGDLVSALVNREDRPWPECRQGKPITPTTLAKLLRPFDVRPQKTRNRSETLSAYRRTDVAAAFARYRRPPPGLTTGSPLDAAPARPLSRAAGSFPPVKVDADGEAVLSLAEAGADTGQAALV